MAVSVAQPAQNREEFLELLDQALAVNPDDVPDTRLATLISQRRARMLQSRVDDLFTDGGAGAPRLTIAFGALHAPVPVVFQQGYK
jgi:hypothetical protein